MEATQMAHSIISISSDASEKTRDVTLNAWTKEELRPYLHYTMGDVIIPEIKSKSKKGKVRDIYFTDENVLMIASDRVSAFDYVLPSLIPFKGEILNKLTLWAFDKTSDICNNAIVKNAAFSSSSVSVSSIDSMMIDPAVVVQKKVKVLPVEFIVRGYLWGSLAAAHEKHYSKQASGASTKGGEFTFCGLSFPSSLMRYEKFPTPVFTPTTKAEQGAHDENITYDEMVKLLDNNTELASQAKELSLALFKRGQELAEAKGLILIDTKYEFGIDEATQKLVVVDEVNTPDSSRMVDQKEWSDKWNKLQAIKASSPSAAFTNVTSLMASSPELKIKEMSKQYVRDVLLDDHKFNPATSSSAPTLTEDQILECSLRYITLYQRLTGLPFTPPPLHTLISPAKRLCQNLVKHSLIKGYCVPIFAGSDSDLPHLQKCQTALAKYNIPNHIRICSAHKQPALLEKIVAEYNTSLTPLVYIGCAGGTDALSGTLSYHSKFPVVSCPPDGKNDTCLNNPPGSSNVFCLRPDNVAKFAAQCFALHDDALAEILAKETSEKIKKLEKADASLFAPIG